MDNKEQKPEITTDDIVAYITNHQTEDKKSPVLSKKKLDDKTEEMVLDKNIADDYIKTLKLYDNKLSDEELKDDEAENKNPRIHIPADQIIIDARARAEEEHARSVEKTREETEHMLEKAKEDIANEQEKAQQAAQAEIAKLAVIAARKIMKTGDAHDTGSNK